MTGGRRTAKKGNKTMSMYLLIYQNYRTTQEDVVEQDTNLKRLTKSAKYRFAKDTPNDRKSGRYIIVDESEFESGNYNELYSTR